ncbi:MAG TPA: AraC family transcriptional regulator [Candidatus Limnocylindrales bacterium]|nr:AraC family transcriptional regulator [Candidatus Limnocylindrales bacterium]
MAVYVWQQDMAPDFPLAVLEYTVTGDADPMHWHDHFEVALVREGRGVFMFGRRALEAEPGDVFLVDNSQPHVALADRGTPLRLLLVLFRPELIAPVGCRELDLGYLAPFRFDEGTSPRVRGGSRLATEIARVLLGMEDLDADGCARPGRATAIDPARRQLLDASLRMVLALASSAPGVAATPEATRAAADRRERIRPVLAYVDRHCREGITLDDVAAVAHVSPSRVRHVFKDVTGVSFKEYVTQVRMTEAKRLLLGTELSVADVAGTVSYTNLHQFYKVFARSCGMSPGEYRRYYTPARA